MGALAAIAPLVSLVGAVAPLAFMGGAPAAAAPPPSPVPTAPPPPPAGPSENEQAIKAAEEETKRRRQAFNQEDTIKTSGTGLLSEEQSPLTILGGN